MKRNVLFILFSLVIFISNLPAQEAIPMDPRVRIGQLDNGFTYYIMQNDKPEDRVELRLAVKTGSVMEDKDQLGLAHFVEHMAFNGTENFEKSELVDFLESVGTRFGPDLNAYTSFDETVYMLQARTDDEDIYNKAFLVMEDWAGGLLFDHEEIDKERGVVMSEWRSRLGAGQRMQNEYFPVIYKDSRYAQRLPIGDPEIIENAPYDALKRFYTDWYRPDLMALIVVGDVDVDAVEAQIKERFAKLEGPINPRPRKQYDVPTHNETLISIVSDDEATGTNARVMYKHPHKPVETMQDYRRTLVQNLYNRMLNSRLDELSQSAEPPFLFGFSGYSQDVGDIDAYTTYVATKEGSALTGLEAALTENERVLQHGFTQSELDRAKTETRSFAERAVREMDKTESGRLVMRYVYHFLDNNPIPGPQQYVDILDKHLGGITLEEINELPKEWIRDENRVVVVTGPEKAETPMPTEDQVRAILARVETMEVDQYEDNSSDAPLLDKELMPVGISAMETMEEVDITRIELANGVEVYLKPTDFKNDEILMTATSEGGNSLYSEDMYRSASSASSIINQSGIGTFDLIQLEKKLSGKIVNVSPFIGTYYEGMRGSASPKDFETMLKLVYLYFDAPRKDADAFQSYMSRQKAFLENMMSNPNFYFADYTNRIKYNDHPRAGYPTVEDMEEIDLDEAFEVYKDRFADASDFAFFFVGAFDIEEIKPMLQTYLGNLPTMNRKETWKDVGLKLTDGVIKESIVRGKAPRAQVEVTFHGEAEWNGDNVYAMRSLIEVLRIKMRESMREDKGGVYGVSVRGGIDHYPREEYTITVSFNSEPDRVQELVETAMMDVKNAMKNGAEEKDLEKVRETQRQGMVQNLEQNRYWNRQMEYAYENDMDMKNISMEYLEEKISELDSDMIKDAANRFFNFESMMQFVMFPDPEEGQQP